MPKPRSAAWRVRDAANQLVTMRRPRPASPELAQAEHVLRTRRLPPTLYSARAYLGAALATVQVNADEATDVGRSRVGQATQVGRAFVAAEFIR